MKFFLLVVGCFVYVKALECGIKRTNDKDFHKVVALCVKNNATLAKIIDMTSSDDSDSDSDSSSEEKLDIHLGKMIRIKRSRSMDRYGVVQEETTTDSSTENNSESTTDKSEESTETDSELCIIKCFYEQFGMMDADGILDHEKFVKGLLSTAESREVRDFLQDSADECFQQIDKEVNMDSCTYSSQLAGCLAEKGKANCEDWPVADLPFTY